MQAWRHLFIGTRAWVYLLWAVLVTGGFIAYKYADWASVQYLVDAQPLTT